MKKKEKIKKVLSFILYVTKHVIFLSCLLPTSSRAAY